jgi:glycine cleavage system H protein
MTDTSDLMFTRTHEWIRIKGKNIVVGITDFMQNRLSDITGVDLPEPDEHHYEPGEDVCLIESLKAACECHAPVSGMVVGINTELLVRPELINADPYGIGWIFEMKPDNLLDVRELCDLYEYEAGLPEEEEE